MKLKLINSIYIIICIIAAINGFIYYKFHLTGFYKDVSYILMNFLGVILGGLMILEGKYTKEKNQTFGERFCGKLLFIISILQMLLILVDHIF